MIRFFSIFLILFTTLCFGADHETFKNCSRVDFCSNLRNREPKNIYSATGCTCESRFATINLIADEGSNNLTLQIYALKNNKLRIKIKETNSTRYELEDVLKEDPEIIPFHQVINTGADVTLTISNTKVVVNYSPISIKIYTDDILALVVPGDRLILNDLSFAVAVSFPSAVQLYGIHEHAENLALPDTANTDPFRLRNLDVAGYEVHSPMSLYGAIPVLYGHGPTLTSGIFLHNAAEQWYEISNGKNTTETYIMAESGTLDLFVLLGPNPVEIVRQYTDLTGTAHLPQLFTLGYHQCRWNYDTQEDLQEVVQNFNDYSFPLDAIWLDIEYTDAKKYFTWNPTNFSDPLAMQQNISLSKKRLITIIDPHIKAENGYSVYDGGIAQDLFVKNADGSVFEGVCWPGVSSYMDFLNPKARDYYSSFYSFDHFPDTTPVLSGIWNDMNEPSVFDDSIEKTLPGDSLHYNGVVHRDIHNIYGLLHTMSTHKGLINRENGTTRPFILSRSHFAGSQRYTAIWTGDNTAKWEYLAISYAECLNANLLGIVFCGADVGGFDQEPTIELLQRWYQAGAWLPFYRAHANMGTNRREPYLFDENVQNVIRDALQLRYRHISVWYTLFYEHTRTGDPIIRPIFYQYPAETEAYKIDTQLLVGQDILVAAVTEPEVESVDVYFPGGEDTHWLSIYGEEVFDGSGVRSIPVTLDSIPVYYRFGSIIITKDTPRLNTEYMSHDGYTLYVNLGHDKQATGTIYIDDYKSFNYENQKEYSYFRVNATNNRIRVSQIDDSDAKFDFVIHEVVFNELDEQTTRENKQTYSRKVFKMDSQGRLLRDLTKAHFKQIDFEIVF